MKPVWDEVLLASSYVFEIVSLAKWGMQFTYAHPV